LRKQRSTIFQIKTDSVLFKPTRRAKDILGTLAFKDLAVRDAFEDSRGARRLNEYHALPTHSSTLPVFRVDPAQEADPMKMEPSRPQRAGEYRHSYKTWQDLDKEEAKRRVLHGESLFVQGVAGTGKSHFVKECVEELVALGKTVDIIAKTHTASSRVGGVTADHYVRRHILHGGMRANVVFIDEVSQIETALWAQLNKVQGVQWLIAGDFNQMPPFFDTFRGSQVHEEALAKSSFFKDLAGCNRLTLTEGHRSDMVLFDFYSSLIPGGARFAQPLPIVLEAARTLCSFEGPARHNLVISHRRRIRLNRELNKTFIPVGVTPRFVRASPKRGQLCSAQNLWLWPGVELLGCVQASRKGIGNNVLYRVTALGEDHATLEPAEGPGEGIELTYPQVADWLRLSFAQTYASVQGTEFSDSLRLHDTVHAHFSMRLLFVAMSRGKQCAKLAIS
jgi:hypothetical protein